VTELADQGKIDDLHDKANSVPKIIVDQTPSSSGNSDDSGVGGGESNATLDGMLMTRSIIVIVVFPSSQRFTVYHFRHIDYQR
jgi:hypothetical protein